jgi:CDP-diacylglycerol--glycerol-3-phosphate 3-phosphatidyltransferase
MPSVYNFKPAFQSLLRPLARWLAQRAVTANEVTIAALALSSIQGAFITWQPAAAWPLLLMPLTLLARLSLNAIDGLLAREHGSASALGVLLNELGDLISDIVLYLPLALVPGVAAPLIVVAVCLALVSEATALVARQISNVRGNQGPMGKSDRAVLFGLLALALGLRIPPGTWINGLLALTIVLLAATIVNRAGGALLRTVPVRGKGTSDSEAGVPNQQDEPQQTNLHPFGSAR